MQKVVVLLALLGGFAGCSSAPTTPQAHVNPAAMAAGDMFMDAPMPERKKTNNMQFFNSQCSPTGSNNYYSATAYFCEER